VCIKWHCVNKESVSFFVSLLLHCLQFGEFYWYFSLNMFNLDIPSLFTFPPWSVFDGLHCMFWLHLCYRDRVMIICFEYFSIRNWRQTLNFRDTVHWLLLFSCFVLFGLLCDCIFTLNWYGVILCLRIFRFHEFISTLCLVMCFFMDHRYLWRCCRVWMCFPCWYLMELLFRI